MKLSCLPVSYFGKIIKGEMSIDQWARQAKTIGLDAIDVSILFFKNHDPEYVNRVREGIQAAGMQVAVVNTYPDFTHPDPAERRRQLSQLKSDIIAASALGAKMVRVTAGQAHPEVRRKEGVSWALEGLTRSLDVAEHYGIKLVYENHSKPGIWEYPDFSHPSDIFLEIAEGIAGTSIGILFDTANPVAYGDDPLWLLERVIDRVVCIHAADTRKKGALEPVLLGTGLVPFYDIFSMLKSFGFDGWISIEEASGLGRSGVMSAVKFVRGMWAKAGIDDR